MSLLIYIAVFLFTIILVGWLGFRIQPRPFVPYPERTPEMDTVPLPADLPAPVVRFFRILYGEHIPVIKTVVIKGRATVRFGLKMPARFLFVHHAGYDYRHYFEVTWFGLPILKVNESYLHGKSLFELPFGTQDNDASVNQGANMALWAEAIWFPAIWVTDPRVRWQSIDEQTAVLFVPYGTEDKEENFIVRFDPDTGLFAGMEGMRCREAGQPDKKVLWLTRTVPGPTIPGSPLSATGSVTWLDQSFPWAVFTLEDISYNVDISDYIRQKGET
jgi:hypothetical protein